MNIMVMRNGVKRIAAAWVILALLLAFFAQDTLADVTYVHPDHLGSPVAYTDAMGNVIGREYYTPHGESLNPPTTDDTVSFTGHVRDGDTGLVYMQARYYDPEIGRFLSVDPVTFSPDQLDHFNRYWYANGNPYRFTDPSGMCSEEHSDSEWACRLEDAITEALEPIVEDVMESAGVEVAPEDERDPEGEYDYEAEGGQSIAVEIGAIVVGGIKSRTGNGGLRRKPGSLGKFKGSDAHKRENKQARDAAKAAGLNKEQRDKLHRQIGGQDLSYQEIVEIAKEIKRNGG